MILFQDDTLKFCFNPSMDSFILSEDRDIVYLDIDQIEEIIKAFNKWKNVKSN